MTGTQRRKAVALHIHDPKSHETKQELADRAEAEINMGEVKFTPPDSVRRNAPALKKWNEITGIYRKSGLTLVTSTDNGVLGRYCQLYAEYENLVEQRRAASAISLPVDDTAELLALTETEYQRERAARLWGLLEYFTSLDGVLKLDDKINRKAEAILKIEDRIFLNPAAKVRTLPIKRKPKDDGGLGGLGFDV